MNNKMSALNSISKKFLIPTLTLSVALFCSLGIFMANNNKSSIESMMDSKGDAIANFVTRVSADYFAIFDFSDFEKFTKALESDPEVEFALFYNAQKEPLTEHAALPDTSALIVYDREIKDERGNIQGYLKIGYNKVMLEESLKNSINIVTVSTLIALLLLTTGIIFLVRIIITKRVKATVDMLKDIAEGQGDLTKRLHADSGDELGDLAKWFNKFVSNIHEIISTVQVNAAGVATASNELSSTADSLNRGSSEQTSQTEQVASAMTEMSQSISAVVSNASVSLEASKEAADLASRGKDTVIKTVEGMEKIAIAVRETSEIVEKLGRSSAEIGEILNVINDIADQTNLLALNAAIEAARAGEHGRGFAVVADEVKKLAESTGQATKEISEMINKIQEDTNRSVSSMNVGREEVDNGVKLAQEAMMALEEIVETSKKAADTVLMINKATEEQSSSTERVTENMESILIVTQQSSSATDQIKMASVELDKLSSDLRSRIGLFKV